MPNTRNRLAPWGWIGVLALAVCACAGEASETASPLAAAEEQPPPATGSREARPIEITVAPVDANGNRVGPAETHQLAPVVHPEPQR